MSDNPAREAEQEILAAVFRDNSLAVTLELTPEDFGDSLHAKLWDVARDIVRQGRSFSAAQVAAAAPELSGYLTALAHGGSGFRPQIDQWASLIRDAGARRRLQDLARGIAEQAMDPALSPEELVADFMARAAGIGARSPARGKRAVAEQVYRWLKSPAPCYPTGLARLDQVLAGGLFAGKVVGLAARKKIGKTVLCATISHNLNRAGIRNGFIGLEMSDEEVEQRNMAREMGINSIEFLTRRNPNLADRVATYAATIPDNTVFEHMPGASLDEVRRAASRMVTHHGVKGIFLDYWQLIGGKPKGETEEFHLRSAAQWFADFCRQKSIFGFIAAQVNQEGNTRGGEGLKLACDVYFQLHREKDEPQAWLEMEESRYLLYSNVGSAESPGLILNPRGPFFEDAATPAELPLAHAPGWDLDRESAPPPRYSALANGGDHQPNGAR